MLARRSRFEKDVALTPIRTTDAAATVFDTYVPNHAVAHVFELTYRISAMRSDKAGAGFYIVQASFRCNGAGTLTLIGSQATTTREEANVTSLMTTGGLTVVNNNAVLTVTGIAATTFDWEGWRRFTRPYSD